jgi:hypothetical protein
MQPRGHIKRRLNGYKYGKRSELGKEKEGNLT